MSQQIMQCFFGADLRAGHAGLAALAKKHELDVKKLAYGQYVIFINNAKDKLKLYAASNVIAYLKLESGQKLNLETIREIPRVFQAKGNIDYNAALKTAVLKAMERRSKGKSALSVFVAEKQAGLVGRH